MKKRFLLTWFVASGIFLLVCPMSQANARPFAVSAPPQRSANVAIPAGDSAPAKGSWKIVPSRNPGGPNYSFNLLSAVAAVSANDVWTVGFYSGPNTVRKALFEQWNGTRWSVVPGSNPGMSDNELIGVAAVSANDIWAVGRYGNSNNVVQTLIEHWNGKKWSVVTSPNIGTEANVLNSVAVVSANDVWAVGFIVDPNTNLSQTLIEHWNGRRWSIIPSPNRGTYYNELWGATAVSASDVWTVGYYNLNGTGRLTLIEQWNGTKWSVVPGSNPGLIINELNGVTAFSANDIWAVGDTINSQATRTLIEHWNGTRWSVVKSPSPGGASNYLSGVAATSATDIWAVGEYYESNPNYTRTIIEHWDGSRWRLVPSPNRKNCSDALLGVAAVSASDVWAVGLCFWSATLTEHYA